MSANTSVDSGSAARAKRASIWTNLPFIVVLLLGVAGFIGLSRLRRPPETIDRERAAPLVETTTIRSSTESLELTTEGEVVPFRHVSLAAQVGGRIARKEERCQAGTFVREGDRLITIDPRDYDLEIARIQQLIKQTEVDIEESDVQERNNEQLLTLAEDDLKLQVREVERIESLIRQQATSQSALDAAQRARIQSANAALIVSNQLRLLRTRRGRFLTDKERLLVELEQAVLNRGRCEITAPMDGMITSDPIEQDDFVQPGAMLLQLEDTRQIEIRFDLKLDELRWIWQGGGATYDPMLSSSSSYELPPLPVKAGVDVDGYRWVWDAVLMRYDGAGLNPVTRTVPCIALVKDPRAGRWDESQAVPPTLPGPPALLRGMFVTVQIEVPSSQPLLQIPIVALRPGNQVWAVRDGQIAKASVKIAQSFGDRLLLFSELSDVRAGEQLVVSPLALAVDGMQVRSQATTLNVSEVSAKPAVDGAISGPPTDAAGQEMAR